MTFRLSNNLLGILNTITFFLGIPILALGIWLTKKGVTECEKFLQLPLIIIGVFLTLVSLAGIIGACCQITWLLWIYLFVMFLLIIALFVFTIFSFVITNQGAGKKLAGRGYKEYRLGDYSNWLQNRVNDNKNWRRLKSCLSQSKFCTYVHNTYTNLTVDSFHELKFRPVESGCCKPPDNCGFKYMGNPTVWEKTEGPHANDHDCQAWDNKLDALCYNCDSCKAGLLEEVKRDWKITAIANCVLLVILVIVYAVGCCAFNNNRKDGQYYGGKYP